MGFRVWVQVLFRVWDFCTALALENGSIIRIVMNALYRAVREQGVGFQYSPTAAASDLLLGSIGLKILWR